MPRYTSQGNVDEENNYAREVQSQINRSVTGKSWRPLLTTSQKAATPPLPSSG